MTLTSFMRKTLKRSTNAVRTVGRVSTNTFKRATGFKSKRSRKSRSRKHRSHKH